MGNDLECLRDNDFDPSVGIELKKDHKDRRFIMSPWLRQGDLVLLYAPSGVGKTRMAVRMACALCTGTPFLRWSPQRSYNVSYFDGEMGKISILKLFRQTADGMGVDIPYIGLRCYPYDEFKGGKLPDLSNPKHQELYDKLSLPSEIIIIDNILTAARLQSARDNDFSQWERIEPWIMKKRSEGKCVVLIHHSGKSGDQLGTSTRIKVMDSVIHLRDSILVPPEDFKTKALDWRFEKKRDFSPEEAQPLYMEFREHEGRQNWHWDLFYEKRKRKFTELYHTAGLEVARESLGLSRSEAFRIKAQIEATEGYDDGL